MLINLTNHPLFEWCERQKNEAISTFGSIKEIPFPVISPQLDKNGVLSLVNKYFELCVGMIDEYPREKNAILVMGEMTFSFSLIEKLKKAGILCLATTTDRKVEFVLPNRKVSSFQFVRFREY